jgi:hypothetical protein
MIDRRGRTPVTVGPRSRWRARWSPWCRGGTILSMIVAIVGAITVPGASRPAGADGFLSPSLVAAALVTPAELGDQLVRSQRSTGQSGSLVDLGSTFLSPLTYSGGVVLADAFFAPADTGPRGLNGVQVTLAGFRSDGDAIAFLDYLAGNVRSVDEPALAVGTDPRATLILTSESGFVVVRVVARQSNVVLGVKVVSVAPNLMQDLALQVARTQAAKINAAMSGATVSSSPAPDASRTPPTGIGTVVLSTPSPVAAASAVPPTASPAASPLPTVAPTVLPAAAPSAVLPAAIATPTQTDVNGTDEDPAQPRL